MNLLNMHQRLEDMRARIYRRRNAAPHASQQTFPSQISLCEGGCLLRPHPIFFKSILDMFADYLNQPLQIYPQNNMFQPMLDLIETYHREVCGLPHQLASSILFGMGSSQILEAMLAVVRKNKGIVLMPTSCYHAFVDWPLKWGMKSVCIPTLADTQYKLTGPILREWLEKNEASVSNISMLLLANPTTAGAIYSDLELKDLATVIAEYELPVFMDEVYRGTEYGSIKTPSLAAQESMEEWVVTANSPSKSWQCANLRAGWASVPTKWLKPMQKVINNSVTELPFILQAGLYGALQTPREYLDIFRNELEFRSKMCRREFAAMNERLNKHFRTTGVRYVSLPFIPAAGHFIVVNLNAFDGAEIQEGCVIQEPLELGSYLHDYHYNGQAYGVTLSAGYSKGHDDYTFYLSFAQLGFEVMSEQSQPVEIAYMLNTLLGRAAEHKEFQQAHINSESICVPEFDPMPGLQRGRDILEESFRRIESALKTLVVRSAA